MTTRQRPVPFRRPRPAAAPDDLCALVPDLELQPEWQQGLTRLHAAQGGRNPDEVADLRRAVALRLIRALRTDQVRDAIANGDPFWTALALSVIATPYQWHQSMRIKLNAMRALRRRLDSADVQEVDRRRIVNALTSALLFAVDAGIGEEFRAVTRIARRIATPDLVTGLEHRSRDALERPIRINAQRMLDAVHGKPYRRYGADTGDRTT